MRNATQRKTGGVARRRPIESRTQAALIVDRWTVSLLPVPQCQRRITERSGHADQITDLRRAAQQGACWRDGAKSCDRDRQGTPRGVATDARDDAADRPPAQPGTETLQHRAGRFEQPKGERESRRTGATPP